MTLISVLFKKQEYVMQMLTLDHFPSSLLFSSVSKENPQALKQTFDIDDTKNRCSLS